MKYVDINSKITKINQPISETESVKNAINNILSTPKGTFPGNPEFGSDLNKFLFELITPVLLHQVKEEVKYSIHRWEPRVKIKAINIADNSDYNELIVYLELEIIKTGLGINYRYVINT